MPQNCKQHWLRLQATVGKAGWIFNGFNGFLTRGECSVWEMFFTFQLIYIHANKEIDATKLYWISYPRTFQDIFYNSTVLFKKVNCHSVYEYVKTYLSLYTLPKLILMIARTRKLLNQNDMCACIFELPSLRFS